MKILLTGFEPFDNSDINPSWEAVKKVTDIQGVVIVKKEMPVTFYSSLEILFNLINEVKPDAVLLTGLAQDRKNVTVERIAININDARIPDNDGLKLEDKEIFSNGKNAYFSTLPIKNIVKSLNENKIDAAISNTAGTYVCNHLMYGLLYYLEGQKLPILGGFIHLPYDLSDSMPKALEIAIKEIYKYEQDHRAI